jgi:hypothetical protein
MIERSPRPDQPPILRVGVDYLGKYRTRTTLGSKASPIANDLGSQNRKQAAVRLEPPPAL